MVIHLASSTSRALVLVASIGICLWLSYFGIRGAIARHAYEANTRDNAARAVQLEPGNPDYWHILGEFQASNLEIAEGNSARKSYLQAIALNPQATNAWLDLATLDETEGNAAGARADYLAAKKSYPASAQVSWRYGNFLLRQGDRSDAYGEWRHAIGADPSLATLAFTRAYRSNPDITRIIKDLLPAKQSVYLDVITEALSENNLNVAKNVWQQLMTIHPQMLEVRYVAPFVSRLGTADDPDARRVWDQGIATMNLPPLYQQPGSVVWDPSFESGLNLYPLYPYLSSSYSFAWGFNSLEQGVRIMIDENEKHTGKRSLMLAFDGQHDPDLLAACSLSMVQPNTSYVVSGWIKTKEITTDRGVAVQVSSLEEPNLPATITREIYGTKPWTFVTQSWTSGLHTQNAQVCITRKASDDSHVRISGQGWVDDVNLAPAD